PRAHPAGRPGSFVLLDRRRDVRDQIALGVLAQVALLLGIGDAVAENLVAPLAQPRRDVGAVLVDGYVHLRFQRKVELVGQLEESPDADAVAVVAPTEDAVALRLVGRSDRRALAHAPA